MKELGKTLMALGNQKTRFILVFVLEGTELIFDGLAGTVDFLPLFITLV